MLTVIYEGSSFSTSLSLFRIVSISSQVIAVFLHFLNNKKILASFHVLSVIFIFFCEVSIQTLTVLLSFFLLFLSYKIYAYIIYMYNVCWIPHFCHIYFVNILSLDYGLHFCKYFFEQFLILFWNKFILWISTLKMKIVLSIFSLILHWVFFVSFKKSLAN